MAVSLGYKQTDVGLVPKEWDAVLLDKVAIRGSGHTPNKKHPEYWNGGIRWISLADSDALDCLYISDTHANISALGLANSSAVLHPVGTVVLSRDAGVGKSAIMRTAMAVSQHFMAWRCGELLDNRYLYYWLQGQKSEFERISNGTTIKTIGLRYFKDLRIPLPPLSEQCAIADALLDVDLLLFAIDRIISKKRGVKEAMMQQLLTGNTRLAGFRDEWDVKRLGDIVEIKKGQLITGTMLKPGDVPVIAGGKQPAYFHSIANRRGRTITISASGASAGYVALYDEPIFASDCSTISELGQYCLDFIYFLLSFNQEKIYRSQTGGAQPHIHPKDLTPLVFAFPEPPEQVAIAEILTDMESEVRALEIRREKTRAVKQGMMQQLLTGKVRLA